MGANCGCNCSCTGAAKDCFKDTLVKKLRSFDTHGAWKNLGDEVILKPFVKNKEQKKEIDMSGPVDIKTLWHIRMYYEAVGMAIEEQTGKMCYTVLDINYEGFGRALVIHDDYVLVVKALRDAHKFGYKDIDDLCLKGEKFVESGIKKLQKHGLID